MNQHDKEKVYFAETNFRNQRREFGIKRGDRNKHMYIIGKTGMGKTTLLENMVIQDIRNGDGVGVIDPHGEFAEKMLDFVPKHRMADVIYFDPSDLSYPIGFNIMENVEPDKRHLIASGLMGVFKKIWVDVWSARMEYILGNTVLALLEYPGSTLLSINRMLAHKGFRKEVVSRITDPVVRSFWVDEFAKYTDRYTQEALPAIQNKIGQFTSNPLIRNIVGQEKSSFDMREVMDKKKILIMNLSKGRIGEENSRLLGAMLITKLYLGAMSRIDISEELERPDFFLYVDEFQNFASESFASILSEARKYHLNLILAHQYIMQMDETVRDAVFGNIGTMLVFRVGAADAEFLEKEFEPEFNVSDIVNLPFASVYLKLMIDGIASRPFSARTLAPLVRPVATLREHIKETSRAQCGRARADIETKIAELIQEKEEEKPQREIFTSPQGSRPVEPFTQTHPPVREQREFEQREPQRSPQSSQDGPEMYEAYCAVCGKKTIVPFLPDGKRPLYCKTHRRERVTPPLPSMPREFPSPHRPSFNPGSIPSLRKGEPVIRGEKKSSEEGLSLRTLPRNPRAPQENEQQNRIPNLDALRKSLQETLEEPEEEEEDPFYKDDEEYKEEEENTPDKNSLTEEEKNVIQQKEKETNGSKSEQIIRPGERIKF